MSTALEKLVAELHATKTLKAWSLIITFFGDAIEPRGGVVAASTLQSVMEVMGVGAGAVRTACSRLAKDGWIERQKQGRNSFFYLSDMGHTPFKTAGRRIYAAPATTDNSSDGPDQNHSQFTVVVQNPLNTNQANWQSLRNKGIRLGGNGLLFYDDSDEKQSALGACTNLDDLLIITGTSKTVPDWVKQSICPAETEHKYHLLVQRFERIQKKVPTDPLTALAVRCLLIHEWRRVLLRSEPIPLQLQPADWPHNDCHQFVATLYQQVFAAGEQWMNDNALGPDGLLNTTSSSIGNRFVDAGNEVARANLPFE